jgi:hypothetical protein
MWKDLGLAVLLGVLVASSGQVATSATPRVKVRLALQWVHQAQLAGYYLALEDGLYRSRGLDVEILRGGPDRDTAQLLRTGQAEVGTFFLTGAMKGQHHDHVPRCSRALLASRGRGPLSGYDDGVRPLGWGGRYGCLL